MGICTGSAAWSIGDFHGEHHHLGRYGGHLIAETIRINSGFICCEGVFSIRFSIALKSLNILY